MPTFFAESTPLAKYSNALPKGLQFIGKQKKKTPLHFLLWEMQREVKENGGLEGRAASSISSNMGDVVERQGNELGKALQWHEAQPPKASKPLLRPGA